MVPTDLISLTQASRLTGFSRTSLYRWIKAGELTGYGRVGTIRVSLAELYKPIDPTKIKPRWTKEKKMDNERKENGA